MASALTALTLACGGSSPTSPSGGLSTTTATSTTELLSKGTLRASIDGAGWEAPSPAGFTTTSIIPGQPGLISVSGIVFSSGAGSSSLGVSVAAPLAVGTYTVGGSSFVTFSVNQDFTLRWTAGPIANSSGTVTVTTASPTHVAGTFEFTAVGSAPGMTPPARVVTNGVFDLSK